MKLSEKSYKDISDNTFHQTLTRSFTVTMRSPRVHLPILHSLKVENSLAMALMGL